LVEVDIDAQRKFSDLVREAEFSDLVREAKHVKVWLAGHSHDAGV